MLGAHCNFSYVITVVDQCMNYLQRLGVPLSKLSHSNYQVKGSQEGLSFQGKKQSVLGRMCMNVLETQSAEALEKAQGYLASSETMISTNHNT